MLFPSDGANTFVAGSGVQVRYYVVPTRQEPKMERACTQCGRPFTLTDLSREETENLEAGRKTTGLEGVKFLYFHCPACGMNDIFVAILPLETEFAEDYHARREAMEKVVRGLHADNVAAVVVPLQAPL
jgi:hypothetical protein